MSTRALKVGIVGSQIPRQLLLALGAVPYRVTGSWQGEVSPSARDYLGSTDAVAARIFDALVQQHETFAGIVVSNDSLANLRLFYVLRMLASKGEIACPVHLLDTPSVPGEAAKRFVTQQYRRLVSFISALTHIEPDLEAFRHAADEEFELATALARSSQARKVGRLSGSQYLDLTKIATTSAPAKAIASIAIPSTSSTNNEPVSFLSAKKIFVTGSDHPDSTVYRVIEDAGFHVVGEDHATGDGAWMGSAAVGSSVDEILHRLAFEHARRTWQSPRASIEQRTAAVRKGVTRTGAHAVLALVREHDDAPLWDEPRQRASLAGIPFISRQRITADAVMHETAAAVAALQRSIREDTQ